MREENPQIDREKSSFGAPRIIVINGDVCSGSSTLAREISHSLGWRRVDAGTIFRRFLRRFPVTDNSILSEAINNKFENVIATGSGVVLEGRLVALQAAPYTDVLKILCIADDEIAIKRFMQREQIDDLRKAKQLFNQRRLRDDEFLTRTWGLTRGTIFQPSAYDFIADTSVHKAEELSSSILLRQMST